MCDAATHDAVLGTPSLEYRYPTLRNGGFIAKEYSTPFQPPYLCQIKDNTMVLE